MSSLLFVYCGIKCGKSETFFLLKINSSSRCLPMFAAAECEKMKVFFSRPPYHASRGKGGKHISISSAMIRSHEMNWIVYSRSGGV